MTGSAAGSPCTARVLKCSPRRNDPRKHDPPPLDEARSGLPGPQGGDQDVVPFDHHLAAEIFVLAPAG